MNEIDSFHVWLFAPLVNNTIHGCYDVTLLIVCVVCFVIVLYSS